MERVICLVIGYICGLLQTSYLIGKKNHIDIRKEGSGNAGSTNAIRVMGWKAGGLTFAGDVLKCIAATLITVLIFHGSDHLPLLVMYAGAGVTLGHNFPFYMNFKGGKGIAVMAAMVLCNSFWNLPVSLVLTPITLLIFLVPVVITRYISLGSLLAYAAFLVQMILYGQMGWLGMTQAQRTELYVVLGALTVMAYVRHGGNIKKLLNGTENKFGAKKTDKTAGTAETEKTDKIA